MPKLNSRQEAAFPLSDERAIVARLLTRGDNVARYIAAMYPFLLLRGGMQTLFLTLTRLFGKCMQVRSQAYRLLLVFRIILGPSGFPRALVLPGI